MIRIPIPVILAALVIVTAGVVTLNLKVNYFVYYYTINATDLNVGGTKAYRLDYVPLKIYLEGNESAKYCVAVYVTNALLKDANDKVAPYVEYCDYGENIFGEYRVFSVWGPVDVAVIVTRIS